MSTYAGILKGGLLLSSLFFYVIYTSLSDIYPLLPPLIGVLFIIFHRHYNERELYLPLLVLLCIGFYELDKSLVFGILPIVFFVVHFFVARRLESIINTNSVFIVAYVALLYLLYFAGLRLSGSLFGTAVLDLSLTLIYYLIADLLISLVYYYLFIRRYR